MENLLNLIMSSDKSKFERPTKELRLKRLSGLLGADAVIKIRAIGFDRLDELREMSEGGRLRLLIVCEGLVDFDLSDAALREHLGIDLRLPKTEALKAIFLPGEIDDLYVEISNLSGYNSKTVEEIKKKIEEEYEFALIYYLYREKNIMPGEYFKMSLGEKLIIRAFFEKECAIIDRERRERALASKRR